MRTGIPAAVMTGVFLAGAMYGQRINQDGRILGPLPIVTNSILFDTTNADAVVSAMQIFPISNAWNERVFFLPVLSNSDAMIAQIMSNLAPSRQSLIAFQEMNYVLVPDSQGLQPVDFYDYPDQSDLNGGTYPDGLYPVPTNQPIEGWPTQTGTQTLAQWQTNDDGSDRHSITIEPNDGLIFETWMAYLSDTNWLAANGAEFNLETNGLRPAGWTSGDAAGFPMFSALVRYDEAERGMVEHACRLVVAQSLYGTYIYPATHYAAPSGNTNVNLPAMGQRLRLKAAFAIPTNWPIEERAILLGLKKYGAMVADNGNFFSISVAPDDRWPANCFNDLTSISITNFEVVQTTGPNGGPRSPGAPAASAGPDETVSAGTPVPLQGLVTYSGAPPVIQWAVYAGPGLVTFGNPAQTNTTATFSVPGVYTLMLSADDSIHAVAYSAVVMTVVSGIWVNIAGAGTNINLSWTGGSPPYVLQQSSGLPATFWSSALTTSVQSATLPLATNGNAFFRIQGN
jgi:hypothetical protein